MMHFSKTIRSAHAIHIVLLTSNNDLLLAAKRDEIQITFEKKFLIKGQNFN